jgi:uncharacterized membrane protein YtjA (UPF0391 family)
VWQAQPESVKEAKRTQTNTPPKQGVKAEMARPKKTTAALRFTRFSTATQANFFRYSAIYSCSRGCRRAVRRGGVGEVADTYRVPGAKVLHPCRLFLADNVLPLLPEEKTHMLWYAWVFLVIAVIAAVLGFGGIAAASASIAKICFVIFLVLFLVSLLAGRRSAL